MYTYISILKTIVFVDIHVPHISYIAVVHKNEKRTLLDYLLCFNLCRASNPVFINVGSVPNILASSR